MHDAQLPQIRPPMAWVLRCPLLQRNMRILQAQSSGQTAVDRQADPTGETFVGRPDYRRLLDFDDWKKLLAKASCKRLKLFQRQVLKHPALTLTNRLFPFATLHDAKFDKA